MSRRVPGRLWLLLALAALAGGIAAGCRQDRADLREDWFRQIRTSPGPLREIDRLDWVEMCLAPRQADADCQRANS